jgi:hypothetical protein
MKTSFTVLAILGFASAFPANANLDRRTPTAFERAQAVLREKQIDDIFNATEQFVSTTGEHRFIAPGPKDLRGLCPALNALSNHGYIDRSGYTTTYEAVAAAVNIFGMGEDLAMFLASYAAIVHGDLTSFSIGGKPSPSQAATSSGQRVLGNGISNSHNVFETDASPITSDFNDKKRDAASRVSHFDDLLALHQHSPSANYDIPTLTDFRAMRYAESVETDSFFFNGPFTGLIMQAATYSFMYRMLANHTAEEPAGILTQDVLKSFYAMTTGSDGKLTWTPGNEKIPDRWYRRSKKTPYDNHFFLNDALYMASSKPEFLRLGGNINGQVNHFRPVDVKALTSGVYRAATLHQDWNFA